MSGGALVSIGRLAEQVGLSVGWLRQLANAGEIPVTKSAGGHRRFDVEAVRAALNARRGVAAPTTAPTAAPSVAPADAGLGATAVAPTRAPDWTGTVSLAGLEEHLVWRQVRDALGIDTSAGAGRIIQHAFNEMLNNAIDHSGGTRADIDVWSDSEGLAVRIRDDGQGVFAHVRRSLGLGDEKEAVAELSKGKVTTMPSGHSGEGIFFTSKAVDVFQLVSDKLRWTVDNLRDDQALGLVDQSSGTTVVVSIDPATTRELAEVFARFTEEFEFVRSRPVVKLFGIGMPFVARSEARRLLEGMDRFTEVEIDFAGVPDVGQGFVDEMVRVWPSQHPGTRIVPINMNAAVEFMVRRGLPGGRTPDDQPGGDHTSAMSTGEPRTN